MNEDEELRCSSQRDYTRTAWWDFPRLHEKKEFIREPGKRVSKTAEIYSDDLVLFFSFVSEYFPFVDINVFF